MTFCLQNCHADEVWWQMHTKHYPVSGTWNVHNKRWFLSCISLLCFQIASMFSVSGQYYIINIWINILEHLNYVSRNHPISWVFLICIQFDYLFVDLFVDIKKYMYFRKTFFSQATTEWLIISCDYFLICVLSLTARLHVLSIETWCSYSSFHTLK